MVTKDDEGAIPDRLPVRIAEKTLHEHKYALRKKTKTSKGSTNTAQLAPTHIECSAQIEEVSDSRRLCSSTDVSLVI